MNVSAFVCSASFNPERSLSPMVINGVDAIKKLMSDTVVISSGGGGIPVYRDDKGQLHGLEAVIDKDRSGLKLAERSASFNPERSLSITASNPCNCPLSSR